MGTRFDIRARSRPLSINHGLSFRRLKSHEYKSVTKRNTLPLERATKRRNVVNIDRLSVQSPRSTTMLSSDTEMSSWSSSSEPVYRASLRKIFFFFFLIFFILRLIDPGYRIRRINKLTHPNEMFLGISWIEKHHSRPLYFECVHLAHTNSQKHQLK